MARAIKGQSEMTTLAELRQANLKEQKMSDSTITKPEELAVQLNLIPGVSHVSTSNSSELPVVVQEDVFLTRVRESLSSRTMHPIGSKVTTDMSPALFMRAKRYCVEHGNITLRQVFLDLLTNFLQEEGY
jgi:hypothetical protein